MQVSYKGVTGELLKLEQDNVNVRADKISWCEASSSFYATVSEPMKRYKLDISDAEDGPQAQL